ncbi:MAG: carboxypeptidase-like regulatory domain-containing protein, partial [Pyrinomonadaceae bacterium]|nr:carboxypeptidase-like regulatory domain-containing protein [Pyrinomonadaceae bacterium]
MTIKASRWLKQTPIVLVAIGAILLVPLSAYAQTDQGRIVGTVRDQNGALVPGASVVVKNDRTGEERAVTANGEGVYILPALRASQYTITVSAPNFAVTTITGVQLAVGQEQKLDVTVSPTGVSESIDVIAGASEAAIDTGSARMGATVDQREVVGLPLNGRQLSQLYLQAPGSVNSGAGTFGDIRFSGRAVNQNIVRFDGVEGSAIIDASPGNLNGEIAGPFRLQSSLENVQEFRVDSNNFPAEYGTGTGGQISVVTKSGSNRFHGS